MMLFMAEYPDLRPNDFSLKDAGKGINYYDPAFAMTNDTDQLALNFRQQPHHPHFATQNYSKP